MDVATARGRWSSLLLATLMLAGCGGGEPNGLESPPSVPSTAPTDESPTSSESPPPIDEVSLELAPFISGLEAPLYLTHAGDGTGQMYLVEQGGLILLAETDGTLHDDPFLDIQDRVLAGGERGLLGLAFHPEYEVNGRFFVDYTDENGDTVIAEYQRDSAVRANPDSERLLLRINQPYSNHNGGQVAFGPDGLLYIGMGDGGSGGDPHNFGQRTDTLLGKILRIDVDGSAEGRPYGIPADNPFADGQDGRAEIWALGLRNPWRFSFDRETGDLFIADVGQNYLEEIDATPSGEGAGANYGWRVMEASDCFETEGCDQSGLVLPVAEYSHDLGCSVTGGYVYRGGEWPALEGVYLYADYCTGRIWSIRADDALRAEAAPVEELDTDLLVSSFGEVEAGELYVTDHHGAVYRITAPSSP
jgi:glucose/arabinose dehydrogenase